MLQRSEEYSNKVIPLVDEFCVLRNHPEVISADDVYKVFEINGSEYHITNGNCVEIVSEQDVLKVTIAGALEDIITNVTIDSSGG